MAYLKIKHAEYGEFLEISVISAYNLTNVQNVNRFVGEAGNSVIYPVRMHKKRISVTVEMGNVDYIRLLEFTKYAEFECAYMDGEYEENGYFSLTSEISVSQVHGSFSFVDYSQSEPVQVSIPALFAVSFTIEEV